MTSIASLERRVAILEQQIGAAQPRVPWFLEYAEALTEEEQDIEADWIVPWVLKSFLGGGSPGCPEARGLVAHPDLAPLWCQWHARHHHVVHESSMGRLPPGGHRELYDFWSKCVDPEQERLRQQIVEILLQRLPEWFHEVLTEWRPSSPAACTTQPSERYFKWQQEKEDAK